MLKDKDDAPRHGPSSAAAASLATALGPIAAAVLRRDPADLPIDRPLIALGLDSLAAAELQQAIELRLGTELPAMDLLLEGATLLGLAEEILARGTGAILPHPEGAALTAGATEKAPAGDVPAPGGGRQPLSHGQQALWFLQRLAPASAAYHLSAAVRITGELDAAALARCFVTIAGRHPALRTTFVADRGGTPAARVAAGLRPGFAVVDLRGLTAAGGELDALLVQEAVRPFDLERGPLVRVTLFRRAAREHAMVLTAHHLVADFQSLAILAAELAELYPQGVGAAGAAGAGAAASPPPAPAFDEFVRWQRQLLETSGERLWDYWQSALRGPLPDVDLPSDRPRPAVLRDRGASATLALDRRLAERLQEISLTGGATLFMTLLAGWTTLLHRYTGQPDLLVGTPVAGRGSLGAAAHLQGVVGCCVNPVVLRTDLGGDPAFGELLGRVRRTAIAAFVHQDYPFALLAERLKPVRDPSRSPLFQVMFTVYRARQPELQALAGFALGEAGAEMALGPLRLHSLALAQRPAQLDLSLCMAETPAGIAGSLCYAADLFDRATAARMAGHLATLLAAAAADPAQPIGALPLLGPAERDEVLAGWNLTAAVYPRDRLAHELFEAQAAGGPDACALVAGEARLTYGELDRRANQLADHLLRLGVGPETTVGMHCERSAEMVVGLLGVLKAGGAYLPLDPAYPPERLRTMLDDSGARLVLTQDRLLPALAGFGGRLLRLDADWPEVAGQPPRQRRPAPVARPAGGCGPDNRAYLIYTSGSTGRPKGVEVTHRGLVNFLCSMAREPGLTAGDRLLSVTTLAFDIAGLELYLPLATGATVMLASRRQAGDGQLLLAALRDSAATVMQATPSTWRLLLAAGWQGEPRLKVLCGGEALPADLAAQLAARAGSAWNLYGPTETTIWSAVHRLPAPAAAPAAGALPAAGPVLAGKPIANTRIYLVDRRLQPVAPGVPGELLIGGDGLARGYLGRPDLSAERFIPDPFGSCPGARLYRTGDLARHRAGGALEILGRLDHQVKIRGFRVELGEVEAALAAHPAVRQAVVAARADRGGGRRLVAWLVPAAAPAGPAALGHGEASAAAAPPDRSAAVLAPEELRRFLAERLPEAFIPSRFVLLPSLPLTANGKIDRAALPELDASRPELRSAYRAPRSELERRIAAVWREVLGVEKAGVHDNFFDLGGHSLLLAQVHGRLGAALGRELALLDLYRHPTIGALALHLSRAPAAGEGEDAENPAAAVGAAIAAAAAATGPAPGGLATAAPWPPPAAGAAVAIIGMAGRFPGARDVDELWRRLRDGEELISRLSDEELAQSGEPPDRRGDPAYVKAAGILEDAELFDAAFFGYSPREAEVMDPQHRIFLECAWQALEDAGYDAARCSERIGVYAAAGINTYLHHLREAGLDLTSSAARYQAFIANDKDFVPTRVSYKLGLRGPSVNVQTACSSSLVAVHLACQALRAGECEMALAGGVAIRAPQRVGYLYEEAGILSPDGRCRAFDREAQGTVFGNGAGVVVLKPLARARSDGDHVYAVIKGSAINNDGGEKVGYTAPSVEGQAAVIAAALAAADVPAASVGYVEAHGTGTPMGDPIEVAALAAAFGSGGAGAGGARCALGSIKPNVGHLDTAAGIAGLIKTVQALRHRSLPPSLHFAQANPRIDFAGGRFYVNAALADWPDGASPRRAGVSSFGIGGTNAHLILEEAPEPAGPDPAAAPPAGAGAWQLLVVSAKTPAALEAASDRLAATLRAIPDSSLADLAYTLQVGRHAFAERRVVVAAGPAEGAAALAARDPERVLSAHCDPGQRQIAFLFSGQGTQYVDMGRELYALAPTFRRELNACAELLGPHLGLDLRQALYPEERREEESLDAAGVTAAGRRLSQTALAQPALFAVEYALARLWMELGVAPQAMLGHSVGELVAACLAGVMALPDALALVAARGRLMQSLPGGAMLGVALDEARAVALLDTAEGLSLAAVNGPAAGVISGPSQSIAALEHRLVQEGVRCRRLRVSHAFHSAMMEPILGPFAEAAGKLRLRPPCIPFVSNLTGTWITAAMAQDPAYWARHLRSPVRFADGARELLAEPGRVLVEIGPGNALAALVRQQDQRATVAGSLRHPQERQSDLAFLLRSAGRLWLAGVELDWQALHAGAPGRRRRRLPLPTYPFERQRYWVEPRPGHGAAAGAEAGPAAGEARQPDLADWFQAPFWRQTLRRALPASGGEAATCLALLDRRGPPLLERLTERLQAAGQAVVVARLGERFSRVGESSFTLDGGRSEDWDALFAELAAAGRLPRRIVHAWNVDAEPGRAAEPALDRLADTQLRSFDSLVLLAQALARAAPGETARIVVLSDNLQKVAGEPALCPGKALLLGPVRVIPQEIQGLSCQSIDLLLPAPGSKAEADLVDDLAAEIAAPELGEPVVAYRGGSRFIRGFEAWRPPAQPADAGGAPPLPTGGVVLITGGLGGIGLALAEALAETPGTRLALLGRSPLPERTAFDDWLASHGDGDEVSAKIRRLLALEAHGAQVLAVTADVTHEGELAAALRQVESRLGPVRAVIHAAGVPGGRSLLLATPAEAARVLAPKVRGTLLLWQLLRGRDLDLFLVCSSVTSLLGGFGQCDYCAANAFCDAFAQAHQHRGSLVAAIDWDRWEEVGMAARTPSPLAGLDGGGRGHPGVPAGHPLLDACLSESPGRDTWVSRLSADRHWVLAEHLVAGQPTVPGTAYLEMARAAAAARLAGAPIELRDVVFLVPLAIPAGESREVRTVVESDPGDAGGLTFRVISRLPAAADAEPLWLEHARGRAAAARPSSAVAAGIAAPAAARAVDAAAAAGEPGGFLVTGRRWQSLRQAWTGEGEVQVELELAEDLADDLDLYPLHPALLDIAAGAVKLLGQGNYLPLAYERLIARAPLVRLSRSHLRLRRGSGAPSAGGADLLTADLAICDGRGMPLVEVEGFTMKRVSAEAAGELRRAALEPAGKTLAALGLAAPERPAAGGGIRPGEGMEVFRRILRAARGAPAGVPAQIVVSTRPWGAALAQADASTPERLAAALSRPGAAGTFAPAHPRPEISSLYAAPAGDFELRVAAVWERVLGIERLGVHDNFFELGGTSLSAIQLVGELKRELGVELSTVSVFQAPTVAALARLLRPGGDQPTLARSLGRAEKKKQALDQVRRAAARARR
jgi:amino acid adenylation domain-containing protein